MTGLCERGNESFGVIKCGGFLKCYLLKKVSASWSQLLSKCASGPTMLHYFNKVHDVS
jgi:hypothetical protein